MQVARPNSKIKCKKEKCYERIVRIFKNFLRKKFVPKIRVSWRWSLSKVAYRRSTDVNQNNVGFLAESYYFFLLSKMQEKWISANVKNDEIDNENAKNYNRNQIDSCCKNKLKSHWNKPSW